MKHNHIAITISFFLLSSYLTNCKSEIRNYKELSKHTEVVKAINTSKKVERFKNADLIFGKQMNPELLTFLGLDSFKSNKGVKYFSKSAFEVINGGNRCIYYLYGTSMADGLLHQLRLHCYRNDVFTDDYLVHEFPTYSDLKYDYFMNDIDTSLTFIVRKGKATHHTHFLLREGELINKTFIPDSIIRRQDYIPTVGQKIRILTDFKTRQITMNGQQIEMFGTIAKLFGPWKGGRRPHMIIKLDNKSYMPGALVSTDLCINRTSSLYKLENDKMKQVEDEWSANGFHDWPAIEPTLLINEVYIEYLDSE